MSLSTAPTPCSARSRRAREYRDESPVYPTNRTGEGAMYRCVNDLYDQTGDIDIEYESVEDFLDILAEAVDEAAAAREVRASLAAVPRTHRPSVLADALAPHDAAVDFSAAVSFFSRKF